MVVNIVFATHRQLITSSVRISYTNHKFAEFTHKNHVPFLERRILRPMLKLDSLKIDYQKDVSLVRVEKSCYCNDHFEIKEFQATLESCYYSLELKELVICIL